MTRSKYERTTKIVNFTIKSIQYFKQKLFSRRTAHTSVFTLTFTRVIFQKKTVAQTVAQSISMDDEINTKDRT